MERIEKPLQPQQHNEHKEASQGLIRKWGKILAFVGISSGGSALLAENASPIASLLEQYREGLADQYEQIASEKKDIATAWHQVHTAVVAMEQEYAQSKRVSSELRGQLNSALNALVGIEHIHPNLAKWDTVEPTDGGQQPPVRYYFGKISYKDNTVLLEVPALTDEDSKWKPFLKMWEEISRERVAHFKRQHKELQQAAHEIKL